MRKYKQVEVIKDETSESLTEIQENTVKPVVGNSSRTENENIIKEENTN